MRGTDNDWAMTTEKITRNSNQMIDENGDNPGMRLNRINPNLTSPNTLIDLNKEIRIEGIDKKTIEIR
jgi:hypothetical protein